APPFPTRRSSDLGIPARPDNLGLGRIRDDHCSRRLSEHSSLFLCAACCRIATYKTGEWNRPAHRQRPAISDFGWRTRQFLRWHRRRSEEHTSELQSLAYLVCRLLLE